jgi:DNA-binding Lrp family transcriptional regulator
LVVNINALTKEKPMKAYVLINTRPGDLRDVVRQLRRLEGVKEANMTFGPYDVVAVLQADDLQHLGEMIASQVQPIPGVLETLTCMAVEI